jgi:hypothetical protein
MSGEEENPAFAGKFAKLGKPAGDSGETFGPAQNGAKISLGNAVKPFGNSQKGIGKGRLTWLTASDKYPGIK